jgi:DNA-nicking Smr family endonuclease
MSAISAADAIRGFLARQLGGQCVLLIHGKGLHSGGISVLREATVAELMGPSSGMVHAFATAVPRDGGEGATYVLVKR